MLITSTADPYRYSPGDQIIVSAYDIHRMFDWPGVVRLRCTDGWNYVAGLPEEVTYEDINSGGVFVLERQKSNHPSWKIVIDN